MANNVHEADVSSHKVGSHRRVLGGLTLEELEALWRAWSEQDRPVRQALTWAVVKATIVEQQVALPVTSDQ